MSERARGLAIGLALLLCLVAGSAPRIVGDGGEYMVQAMNFAGFNTAPLGRRAIQSIEPRIHAIAPELSEWQIEAATVPSSDRRRDFLHFWFYALVATPALWVVDAVGISPIHAFTITNLILLGVAIWVLLPRIGAAATLLIVGSPLLWWIDKPHTEVFTAALLAVAFALARERPGAALIAAGMAATQNLPVAIVFVALASATVVFSRGRVLADRAWLSAAVVGGVLVLLHPLYTFLRHGTPSLLLYATRAGFPTVTELTALVVDPSIGLLGNAPFFLLAVALGVVVLARTHPSALISREMGIAVAATAVFLYAAAQTSNTHHGATPSLTRYALWFLPLTVPLFAAVRKHAGGLGRVALVTLALVSSATSVFAFHPNVRQYGREPTWLANWLWTSHPGWQNPLPEIFSEIQAHVEGTTVPVATARCEKILVAARGPEEGTWPVPCFPAELPVQCRGAELLCYANRSDGKYSFARAPGREEAPRHDLLASWPAQAESHVRSIYNAWGWWTLSENLPTIQTLRANFEIQTAEFGTDEKFLVVMRRRGPGASLRLRPLANRLVGRIYDPLTGERLAELSFAGAPGEVWNIDMPAGKDLAILALTSGDLPE